MSGPGLGEDEDDFWRVPRGHRGVFQGEGRSGDQRGVQVVRKVSDVRDTRDCHHTHLCGGSGSEPCWDRGGGAVD